jgi:UDP-N-acetylmuramate dehydrogenase
MTIDKLLPGVKTNIPLKKYTTFKIGGPAKYFFEAKKKEDLIGAIIAAKKMRLPFFILGGGSNLLVSDTGFKGLIINFQFSIFNFQKNKIIVGAGTPLGRLVSSSTEKSLTGLEWAVGVPGTVGGAIYGNAGAFGYSMADVVKSVEVLEITEGRMQNDNAKFKIKEYKNKDCKFSYRESIFKRNKNLIILSAKLQLKKGNKKNIQEKMREYLNYRKENQPLDLPSAGSIFKNPKGFSAGELIEGCGLKGEKFGDVKISEKHANFIVNLGEGKAKDVMKLINLAKKKIKEKFGITLEEEIQFLGF